MIAGEPQISVTEDACVKYTPLYIDSDTVGGYK